MGAHGCEDNAIRAPGSSQGAQDKCQPRHRPQDRQTPHRAGVTDLVSRTPPAIPGLLLLRHTNASLHTHKSFKCKEQGVLPNSKAKQLFTEVYACRKLCWQINCSDPQARGRQTIALPQFTCWILFCLAAWSGVKGSCSEAGSRQQNKGRENTSQPKGTVGKLVIGPCVFGFRQASRFVFPRLEPRLKETRNY